VKERHIVHFLKTVKAQDLLCLWSHIVGPTDLTRLYAYSFTLIARIRVFGLMCSDGARFSLPDASLGSALAIFPFYKLIN
jgi:hypothetical protein